MIRKHHIRKKLNYEITNTLYNFLIFFTKSMGLKGSQSLCKAGKGQKAGLMVLSRLWPVHIGDWGAAGCPF